MKALKALYIAEYTTSAAVIDLTLKEFGDSPDLPHVYLLSVDALQQMARAGVLDTTNGGVSYFGKPIVIVPFSL